MPAASTLKPAGRLLSTVAALALATGALAGQAPLPSDSVLKPYDNVWRYSTVLLDGSMRFQGLWTDHLERRPYQGRTIWLRVQGMTYGNGATSSIINGFELATMLPIYSESRAPTGERVRRNFGGLSIQSIHRAALPSAREDTSSTSVRAPIYDFFGGMYGLLLVGLPLDIGFKGELASIAEQADSLLPARFAVVRRENINAGSLGSRDVRVVTAEQDGARMTFWLSTQAPFIIRLEILNPNGVVARYEMIPGDGAKP